MQKSILKREVDKMKIGFRWYGLDDSIPCEYVRHIPNVDTVVTAVYSVKVGEVWPMQDILKLKEKAISVGLNFHVVESIPVHEDIKLGNIVHCKGPNDSIFKERYSGIYELINSRDNSKEHIFISIPGINQPVGLIILEWMVDGNNIDMEEVTKTATYNYIPRINALILSKSPEKRKWI